MEILLWKTSLSPKVIIHQIPKYALKRMRKAILSEVISKLKYWKCNKQHRYKPRFKSKETWNIYHTYTWNKSKTKSKFPYPFSVPKSKILPIVTMSLSITNTRFLVTIQNFICPQTKQWELILMPPLIFMSSPSAILSCGMYNLFSVRCVIDPHTVKSGGGEKTNRGDIKINSQKLYPHHVIKFGGGALWMLLLVAPLPPHHHHLEN